MSICAVLLLTVDRLLQNGMVVNDTELQLYANAAQDAEQFTISTEIYVTVPNQYVNSTTVQNDDLIPESMLAQHCLIDHTYHNILDTEDTRSDGKDYLNDPLTL